MQGDAFYSGDARPRRSGDDHLGHFVLKLQGHGAVGLLLIALTGEQQVAGHIAIVGRLVRADSERSACERRIVGHDIHVGVIHRIVGCRARYGHGPPLTSREVIVRPRVLARIADAHPDGLSRLNVVFIECRISCRTGCEGIQLHLSCRQGDGYTPVSQLLVFVIRACRQHCKREQEGQSYQILCFHLFSPLNSVLLPFYYTGRAVSACGIVFSLCYR